ncbi:MAG TPA: hypothetical protein VG435_09880 [Acidimicrobiales bacterium]|jgi:hypothetical protein|nr:hypothetical protein [Acidimicrobiales bacterium]
MSDTTTGTIPGQGITQGGINFSAAITGTPPAPTLSAIGTGAAGSMNTSEQIAPPSAATSPYTYQTYVAGAQVVLGATIASILGLSPTKVYQGSDIMAAYGDLNQYQLATLNQYLNSAGLYQSAEGTTITSNLDFGSFNNDNFAAMSAAILQSANTNTPMSTLISRQIASGAGYLQQEGATSPIVGGGNTYQVSLTNPQDMYATALSTFEQELGRAPDQAELNAMTKTLQAQETTYQQALNSQAEGMSQAKYQQQINARTAEQTPLTATGPISNGPFPGPAEAAVAVLDALGGQSMVTMGNVQLMTAWIQANGGLNNQTHNLLGTTTGQTNQQGQTTYSSYAAAIQAAVDMLRSSKYVDLMNAFQSGDATTAIKSSPTAAQQLTEWSGGKITSLNAGQEQLPSFVAIKQWAQTNQSSMTAAPAKATTSNTTPTTTGLAPGTGPTFVNGHWESNMSGTPGQPALTATHPMDGPPLSQAPAAVQALAAHHVTGDPYGGLQAAMQGQSGQVAPGPQQQYVNPSQLGAQGITSQADSYLPANTLTVTQAPSASAVATTEATTGANAIPYLGNQYLQAYAAILSMIKAGGPTG